MSCGKTSKYNSTVWTVRISLSFYIFFLNAKDFSASITQIKSAYISAQLYCKVVFKVV